jgi:hypothetical protein
MFLSSCGKANGESNNDNECSYKIIAAHDCIVCNHGGVSCDWN